MTRPVLRTQRSVEEKSFTPPLFDRLTAEGTQMLSANEVKESVKHEVQKLLNTRFVFAQGREDESDMSFGGYPLIGGLEDFSSSLVQNPEALAARIQSLVLAYEPRLTEIDVILSRIQQDQGMAQVCLKGVLQLGDKRIQISFPVEVTQD